MFAELISPWALRGVVGQLWHIYIIIIYNSVDAWSWISNHPSEPTIRQCMRRVCVVVIPKLGKLISYCSSGSTNNHAVVWFFLVYSWLYLLHMLVIIYVYKIISGRPRDYKLYIQPHYITNYPYLCYKSSPRVDNIIKILLII